MLGRLTREACDLIGTVERIDALYRNPGLDQLLLARQTVRVPRSFLVQESNDRSRISAVSEGRPPEEIRQHIRIEIEMATLPGLGPDARYAECGRDRSRANPYARRRSGQSRRQLQP